MNTRRPVRGIELRYLLTAYLFESGSRTVADLVTEMTESGFALPCRESKAISDALRWEIARGRVRRLSRGRYCRGAMPRQTEARIRDRVRLLRNEAVQSRAEQLRAEAARTQRSVS